MEKYWMAEEKKNAEEVRAAVAEWHQAINPAGFSGNACFNGGCGRPFAKNGCGGMKDSELIF